MDGESNDEADKDEDGSIDGVKSKSCSQVVKLLLQTGVSSSIILGHGISSDTVVSNAANECFAGSSDEETIGVEEWVLMQALSFVLALAEIILIRVVLALVDLSIAALDDQRVCWDSTSCFKKYDVTNNDVPNANAHGGSEFTTDDSNFLLLDEGLKVDK